MTTEALQEQLRQILDGIQSPGNPIFALLGTILIIAALFGTLAILALILTHSCLDEIMFAVLATALCVIFSVLCSDCGRSNSIEYLDDFINSAQVVEQQAFDIPIDHMTLDYLNSGSSIYIEEPYRFIFGERDSISGYNSYSNAVYCVSDNPRMKGSYTRVEYDKDMYEKISQQLYDTGHGNIGASLSQLLCEYSNGIDFQIDEINYSEDPNAYKPIYYQTCYPETKVALGIDLSRVAIPTDKGTLDLRNLNVSEELSDNPKINVVYSDPYVADHEVTSPLELQVGHFIYTATSAKLYAPQNNPQPSSNNSSSNSNSAPKVDVKVDVSVDVQS